MKKRILSLFTSLIMVVSLISVLPTMVVSARISGDYEYYILDDGTVEITAYNGSATTLTIPSTINGRKVTSISSDTFGWNENLINLTISSNVIKISDNFVGCLNLTNIEVNKNNESYSSQDGVLFDKNKTVLIKYPQRNKRTSYTIPNSVKIIENNSFLGCSWYLKNITIPDSVTRIGNNAFEYCCSLINIKMGTKITKIGERAFAGCSFSSITLPYSLKTISDYAFLNCPNLKSVTIPKSVNYIGQKSFGYEGSGPIVKGNFLGLIKCYSGTTGEKYAKDNGFKYELLDVTPPANITKASFKSSANAVKISWNKVSGATGYRVYQYNTSTKKWVGIANTTSTAYTFKNLKAGTTYKFTVRAYKNQGGKTYLSPKYTTFTTSTTPATVSFKLTAGSKKATVKWNKVTGATGYKIYYKTSKNGKWIGLKTANNKTTSYTKTGLTKGKTYYFTVKAYRTVGGKTYNGSYNTKSVKVK